MQSNKICEYKVRAGLLNVIIYERDSFKSVSCATWAFSSPDRTRPSLTLVFLLPWTTTGRESWAVFLTRTRSVPNLSSTSSADYRSKASLWKWAGRYDDRYLKICTFYSGGSKRNKKQKSSPAAPFRVRKIWHLWSKVMLRVCCRERTFGHLKVTFYQN